MARMLRPWRMYPQPEDDAAVDKLEMEGKWEEYRRRVRRAHSPVMSPSVGEGGAAHATAPLGGVNEKGVAAAAAAAPALAQTKAHAQWFSLIRGYSSPCYDRLSRGSTNAACLICAQPPSLPLHRGKYTPLPPRLNAKIFPSVQAPWTCTQASIIQQFPSRLFGRLHCKQDLPLRHSQDMVFFVARFGGVAASGEPNRIQSKPPSCLCLVFSCPCCSTFATSVHDTNLFSLIRNGQTGKPAKNSSREVQPPIG